MQSDRNISPLSFSQERFWLQHQIEPGEVSNRVVTAARLRGPLDTSALGRCIDQLAARHEALRTYFPLIDGVPRQAVMPPFQVRLSREESIGVRREERESLALDRLRRARLTPFDLEQGPLFRATLLRFDDEDHLLFLTLHHIITDGSSHDVIVHDLAVMYPAACAGRPCPLPDLARQYRDFTAWQRHRFEQGALEFELDYWKQRLADCPPPVSLTTDGPPPTPPDDDEGVVQTVVDGRLLERLRALRNAAGTSLFTLLLATMNVLLQRYTGQDDIMFGVPFGRRDPEFEGLIGNFTNTLLLRTDVSGDPSFRSALARTQEAAQGAYRHAEVPFEKVIAAAELRLGSRSTVLLPFLCNALDVSRTQMDIPSLRAERVPFAPHRAPFDLHPMILKDKDSVSISWIYDPQLFRGSTIERLSRHYVNLLRGVIADPDARVSSLPMLGEEEREGLLAVHDPSREYPVDRCVHQLFEQHARNSPEAVAVVCEGQALTYAQLDGRANQLAHHLRSLGVERETLVGLCAERSVEMVVGVLGILKAGAAYVPLDPSYPESRLALMLEDTRAPVLLTQRRLADSLPEFDGTTVLLDADWPTIANRPATAPVSEATADSLAYVIYTSGSTGRPKGVCVEHRSVVRLVRNTNYVELGPDEVFLQFAPISFDASTFELWGSLLNGARLVIFPPQVPSLDELGRVIEEHGITTLWLTAALFKQMVDSHPERLGRVRQLLAGGEELSVPHVQRFLATLTDRRLVNGYGPTENTTFTCCHVMTGDSVIARSVPIGRPISNTQVYVLDKNMEPVPIGVPGRLYAGGDGLARGYLNDAELTARKFVPHPFRDDPRARLYDTGDQARWLPDGTLEFLGREDQQVKIRGFRIELGEIETALVHHPSVREAAVLCHGDAAGEKSLVAYVIPVDKTNPGDGELAAQLRDSLAKTLPSYMMPARFAVLEALPLTANGKLDRTALRAVEYVEEGSKAAFVAPGTPTEQRLAEIWADLLNKNEIGVHDNFFQLGGHSLMAMRVIGRVRTDFDVELPVQSLFAAPTIAGMAKAVDVLRWARTDFGDGDADPDHEDYEL